MSRWKLLRHKWMYRIRRELFRSLEPKVTGALQLELQRRMAEYQELLRQGRPLPPLEETECKVFSQNGEDGILLFLLSMVGCGSRRFLEIGIQDGWECNCANLAKNMFWDGWFVEGSGVYAALARQQLALDQATKNRPVYVLESFVTRENINALIESNGIGPVDLFSLDIDGMDWWVWKEITSIRPRIVVVEYNSAFGPERSVTVPYQPSFARHEAHPSGLYYGASLAALAKLGAEKGYRFVGCNSSGVNAFFVQDDIAPPELLALTAAQAFRDNVVQNRTLAYREQFETIRHLELITV